MQRKRLLTMASVAMAAIIAVGGMSVAVEIGDKAPDFSLPSTTGEKISLGQYKGKKNVLLEFYVADFGGT